MVSTRQEGGVVGTLLAAAGLRQGERGRETGTQMMAATAPTAATVMSSPTEKKKKKKTKKRKEKEDTKWRQLLLVLAPSTLGGTACTIRGRGWL